MERARAPAVPRRGRGRDSAKMMTLEARAQRAAAWLDANSRRLAWAAIAAGVAAAALRLTSGFDALAATPFLAAAGLAGFWITRDRSDWTTLAAYAVAIAFFTQLRDAADETGVAVMSAYVIDWERWLFAGDVPSAWLQARVPGFGEGGWLSWLSAFIHWTWFFFPHAVVLAAYFLARKQTRRVAIIMTVTFYAGVALYYLAPTAPPWMAAEQGLIGGVVREMESIGPIILGQSFYAWAFEAMAEPNPTAAMPSLHFAASFVVVMIGLVLRSRALTGIAALYSAVLAFSLVYLGEHYFADVIAGGIVAAAAFGGAEAARWLALTLRSRWDEVERAWSEAWREAREGMRRKPGRLGMR